MFRKLTKFLVLTTAMLLTLSTLALASGTVSGKVSAVDAQKGTLILMTNDGNTQALTASKNLLAGLKTGDTVAVEIEGSQVKTIQKKQ